MSDISEFYNKFSYPDSRQYQFGKNGILFQSSSAPINQKNKEILVIGCGVSEAILVALSNPKSHVIGIDISENQIAISKSIKRKMKLKNLSLRVDDICYPKYCYTQYDNIVATGVLHHIKDINLAMQNIARFLKIGGAFSGMVYSDERPTIIRELNKFFVESNFTVQQAKAWLNDNRIEWFLKHVQADEEIADTWLNPYFVEYNEIHLFEILEKYFKKATVYPRQGYKFHNMFTAAHSEMIEIDNFPLFMLTENKFLDFR